MPTIKEALLDLHEEAGVIREMGSACPDDEARRRLLGAEEALKRAWGAYPSTRAQIRLKAMKQALEEFAQVEATDTTGDATANAGIGLAMAVGDYLHELELDISRNRRRD